MAPHAISPIRTESSFTSSPDVATQQSQHASAAQRTMISETDPSELHDMICIGFGPASLAIAAALHDSIEFQRDGFQGVQARTPKVPFLERQASFRWHAGMQLPGATMQISWIKDFATLRNPRSSFTFLNYLWTVGRLLQFTDLGTFLPTRLEYEAYMKWVAGWFDRLVSYNQECVEIVPETQVTGKAVQSFVVKTRNVTTGELESRRTRHVVIACGGKPVIPSAFPQQCKRVMHSSSYLLSIPEVCPEREKPYTFAIIGAGQSAAEIFHDLHTRFPNCRTNLLIRQAALKPSDDSPFVNETFYPDHVDDLYDTSADVRQVDILNDKPTNYGVVRLELLETIYRDLYLQRVKHTDPEDWQHRVSPFREVTNIKDLGHKVRLHVDNSEPLHRKGGQGMLQESMDVDAVIVAAGYQRNAHEWFLANAQHLMPSDNTQDNKWRVRRDYSVIFKPNAVSDNAGIWLQGSNECTHGLSDTLLSILAIRGQEVVDSVFSPRQQRK